MTSKKLKRLDELRKVVGAITSIDDPENYDDADAACESILSEIEDTGFALEEGEEDDIGGLVTDWFYENGG